MAKKTLLLSFLIISTTWLRAQSLWEELTPGLSGAPVMKMEKGANGRIFASTPTGLHASDNEGQSWTVIHQDPSDDVIADGQKIYSITAYGKFVYSGNNGSSFSDVSSLPARSVRLLKLSDSKFIIYTQDFTGEKLYLSNDGGVSWNVQHAFDQPLYRSRMILSAGKIFIIAPVYGVLRSDDEGLTFVAKNAGFASSSFLSVAIDPDGTLYRLSETAVYKSVNAGDSWQKIADNPYEVLAADLAVGRDHELMMFDSYSGKTYQLDQATGNWVLKSESFPVRAEGAANETLVTPTSFFYYSDAVSVMKVSDDKTSATLANTGIQVYYTTGIELTNDGAIVVAADPGISRLKNGVWTTTLADSENRHLQRDRLISFGNDYLYKNREAYSSDNGKTWHRTNWYYTVGKGLDNKLFGFLNNVFHMSENFGATWTYKLTPDLPSLVISSITADSVHVYVCGSNASTGKYELHKINPQTGGSEKIYATSEFITNLHVKNSSLYMLFQMNGLHRSDDGGVSWKKIADINNYTFIGNTIWTPGGIMTGGPTFIKYSIDKGETWVAMTYAPSSPNPLPYVYNFTADRDNYVYATVRGGKIIKSKAPLPFQIFDDVPENAVPVAADFETEATEDQIYTFSSDVFSTHFSDDDAGDELKKIMITQLPSGGTLSFNDLPVEAGQSIEIIYLHQLKFIPDDNFFGPAIFLYKLSDGKAFSVSAAQATIQVFPVNDAPEFEITSSASMDEDFGEKVITPTLSEVQVQEYQTLLFSVTPATSELIGISVNENTGVITLSSKPNKSGELDIVLTANDGQSENNIVSKTIHVKVLPVNDAPEFTVTQNVSLKEDFENTVKITPVATNTGEVNETVIYSLEPLTSDVVSVNFNSATGEFSLTPKANKYGEIIFTLTADDGQLVNHSSSKPVTVNIEAVNDPPVLSTFADLELEENIASIDFTIEDVDNPVSEIVIAARSDNEDFIPNINLKIEGAGNNRKLIIGADQEEGEAIIDVTASDGKLLCIREFKVTSVTTGVEISQGSLLRVYPNPVNQDLYISLVEMQRPYNLTLYDIAGRVLSQQRRDEDNFALSMLEYRPGIYFLTVQDSRKQMRQIRVVKN